MANQGNTVRSQGPADYEEKWNVWHKTQMIGDTALTLALSSLFFGLSFWRVEPFYTTLFPDYIHAISFTFQLFKFIQTVSGMWLNEKTNFQLNLLGLALYMAKLADILNTILNCVQNDICPMPKEFVSNFWILFSLSILAILQMTTLLNFRQPDLP